MLESSLVEVDVVGVSSLGYVKILANMLDCGIFQELITNLNFDGNIGCSGGCLGGSDLLFARQVNVAVLALHHSPVDSGKGTRV